MVFLTNFEYWKITLYNKLKYLNIQNWNLKMKIIDHSYCRFAGWIHNVAHDEKIPYGIVPPVHRSFTKTSLPSKAMSCPTQLPMERTLDSADKSVEISHDSWKSPHEEIQYFSPSYSSNYQFTFLNYNVLQEDQVLMFSYLFVSGCKYPEFIHHLWGYDIGYA